MIVRVFHINKAFLHFVVPVLSICGKYWCYAYIVILALVEIHFLIHCPNSA